MKKEELIRQFNELGIDDMDEVKELYVLKGDFINLSYTFPSGQTVKLLDDSKTYYGAEVCRKGSPRCYGLAADEGMLLVCEYGEGGKDAELVFWKRL